MPTILFGHTQHTCSATKYYNTFDIFTKSSMLSYTHIHLLPTTKYTNDHYKTPETRLH